MTWLQHLASDPGGSDILYILALPVAAALVLLIFAFSGGKQRKQYKRRVNRVRGEEQPQAQQASVVSVKRSTRDSNIAVVDQMIKKSLPRRDELLNRMARAGLKTTLGNYLLFCLILGLIGGGALYFSGVAPPIAAVFTGLFCGIGLPHMGTAVLAKRRQTKFIANFPEAIDLMTRGLKSGLPVGESIRAAANEVPDPVGCELTQVLDQVRLGTKLEDALQETATRLGLQEFNFFTISLAIQSETGGNLAETLANLSEVLRKRRQLKLKIRALSGEAKASAYIIGSLPFVMAIMIYLMSPDYIMKLVYDPRGHFMIGLALTSFSVGALTMWKMIRFDH